MTKTFEKRKCSKWQAKKCYRGIQHREAIRMQNSVEPDWATAEAASASVWSEVWFCENWKLWKLLAYCLHVLFDMYHFWDIEAKEHSSPWFAMAWSRQERISAKHMKRLRSKPEVMANRVNIAGQLMESEQQASNADRWRHAMLADVEKHLEQLVKTKIWTDIWQPPKGETDDNWRHWEDFQKELQPWKGLVSFKWLRNQAWAIFIRQLNTMRRPKGSIAVEMVKIKVRVAV